MGTVNTLGIGTMGFGGNVSLIGCKIGVLNRLPASFFVSVAYDCWAFRRLGVRLDARDGSITQWLYRDPSNPLIPDDRSGRVRSHRPRNQTDVSARRRDCSVIEGRRCGPHFRPDVHGPRRRARAPDEARASGRSARLGPVSLRPRGQKRRERMDGHGCWSDDEHPRGTVSGGDTPPLRGAGSGGKGRHGRQDASRAEGIGRRVSERSRRRGPVLRAMHRAHR